MIKPQHLRDLIADVMGTYLPAKMVSSDAVELLMMTAAQESWCGRYLEQEGCGVALGIFQMEPATYRDLHDNFIRYKEDIGDMLFENFQMGHESFSVHMRGNLVFQIVVARLQYYRFPESIPKREDKFYLSDHEFELARYYKKYWNTALGKATVTEVLRNYDKYAK